MLPFSNTAAMQIHLNEISRHVAPKAHGVVLMDRAGWHTTGKLNTPKNITIILLPSRAPELNPVENIWQYIRSNWLSNRVFDDYEAILVNGLPPNSAGSASALRFSGLLTFTCVPARMVAELPKAALCHQSGSIHVVTSMDRPGCYQPERQLLGEICTRQKKAPYSRRTESNPLDRYERFQIMSSSSPGLTLAQ